MKLTTSMIASSLIAATQAYMPDIAAIMAVDPSSFPSYQTGGLIRGSSTLNDSKPIVARDCPNGVSGDGNCCATSPILTWVSKAVQKFRLLS